MMETGTVVLVGAGILGVGVIAILLMNQQQQPQQVVVSSPQTGQPAISQEGSIIYGILSGLGVGIGQIMQASNRPGGNKTPSQGHGATGQHQQSTPVNGGGFDPSRPIGPGNSPVTGFRV
jgi:hypothetical protein